MMRSVGQRLSAIADIDTPQPAHGIKNLVAIGVPDVDAVGPGDDAGATRCQVLEVREGMQEMRTVQRLDLCSVNSRVH